MKILVQKFGGPALATGEGRERAVSHVSRAAQSGFGVVAVFSAFGRLPDPYATDSLLSLLRPEAGEDRKDLLAVCGEMIASAVMADLLDAQGVPCEVLALDAIGIVTDEQHGDATILEIDPSRILATLRSGKVAVVPGFQGITRSGHPATLGRGGSDITAAALGAALSAECVEIYKDVEGVYSADPRLVPEASLLSEMTFQEVGEMAHHGAKVLHPKAVSFAMEAKIPIRIRSNFTEKGGTLITPDRVSFKNVVSGIAHIPDMAYIQVKIKKGDRDEARRRLFLAFAEKGISLDLITVQSQGVDFIVHEQHADSAGALLSELGWEHAIEKGFAKVSVVGAGMRGKPGVMLRVVEALRQAGIRLYHSTDSHITIACLVKRVDMEKAVRALHAAFLQAEKGG